MRSRPLRYTKLNAVVVMTNDPRSGIDKQVDYLVNVLSDLQFKVHKLTERVEELEEYEEPEPEAGTFEDNCDTYWGTHGCDYVSNHTGNHKCYGCYEAWEQDGVVWCKEPGGEPFEYGGQFFVADNYGDLTWDVEGLAPTAYIKPATSGKPGITFQVQTDTTDTEDNVDPVQAQLLADAQSEYPSVRQMAANNPDCPRYLLMFLAYDENDGVRIEVAGNPNTSDKTLWKLVTDETAGVRAEVVRNPSTSRTMLFALTGDPSSSVRYIAKQKLEEDNSGSCSICGGYCGE